MQPITIGLITFGCLFGGAMIGMILQSLLPEHHLKAESKDTVKLGAGLIATMAALVLGLLVGSAKGSFDNVNNDLTQVGAKFIRLDRDLAEFGPEAKGLRVELREYVEDVINKLWPEEHAFPANASVGKDKFATRLEDIASKLRGIHPGTQTEALLHTQTMQLANDITQYRWLVLEQSQNALSITFLVVLLFWLTVLNITYGIYAPRNGTVIAVLLACALSVAGALFLIAEMHGPLDGVIKVSSQPLHKALEYIDQ